MKYWQLFTQLRGENPDVQDRVNGLELQMSLVKEEKIKEVQKSHDSQAELVKELPETKFRLSCKLQDTQHRLDRFHQEMQSLQDELQNAGNFIRDRNV